MITRLLEVNTETLKLATLDGREYSINPNDIDVCCTWSPTVELEIKTVYGQKYCINLSSEQQVRIK